MSRSAILNCLALLLLLAGSVRARERTFESIARPFLEKYCVDCHDDETQKGDISLHDIGGVNATNLVLWKSIWEQVAVKDMPPRKKKNQPGLMERMHLSDWIIGELQREMKDRGGFHAHLLPNKGNHLDHDLLFGDLPPGIEPPSSPARIWRLNPQEHLVRLDALVNNGDDYNPEKPGLAARGDMLAPDLQGAAKIYLGVERMVGFRAGGSALRATLPSLPPIFSQYGGHGLRNYPILYSVNSAESNQIAQAAKTFLRYMAYGPDPKTGAFVDKMTPPRRQPNRRNTDAAVGVFYKNTDVRPITPVYHLMKEPGAPPQQVSKAVRYLFEALTFRPATEAEANFYTKVTTEAIEKLGKKEGAFLGLSAVFLHPHALFRHELVKEGAQDKYGRVMMQDYELALAINAAFAYLPDPQLKQAVLEGRLKTRADALREVTRIVNDESIRKPHILQFFREYFDYGRAADICKDDMALRASGLVRAEEHYRGMKSMARNIDRLVELILKEDKHVLRQLLTTDRVVVLNEDPVRKWYAYDDRYYFTRTPIKWTSKKPRPGIVKEYSHAPESIFEKGPPIYVRTSDIHKLELWAIKNFRPKEVPPEDVALSLSQRELVRYPDDKRMGILTHPTWLVAHSDAMDNHAILRGIWIRERLLGGGIPDVPITVDAQLPDEPENTLRHRMRVTREEYCWKCHKKMDPLGLPFEMFDHLGMYRTKEKGKPVDTTGEIIHSGDPSLDGPVKSPRDMIEKLAASERVQQVFVRHVFRYWMGRNETINDAPTLQAAYQAYKDNDGSMKALLISLLTSDAFLYRKRGPSA